MAFPLQADGACEIVVGNAKSLLIHPAGDRALSHTFHATHVCVQPCICLCVCMHVYVGATCHPHACVCACLCVSVYPTERRMHCMQTGRQATQ